MLFIRFLIEDLLTLSYSLDENVMNLPLSAIWSIPQARLAPKQFILPTWAMPPIIALPMRSKTDSTFSSDVTPKKRRESLAIHLMMSGNWIAALNGFSAGHRQKIMDVEGLIRMDLTSHCVGLSISRQPLFT